MGVFFFGLDTLDLMQFIVDLIFLFLAGYSTAFEFPISFNEEGDTTRRFKTHAF